MNMTRLLALAEESCQSDNDLPQFLIATSWVPPDPAQIGLVKSRQINSDYANIIGKFTRG